MVGDVSVVADLYRQHGPFIHTISQQLVGAAADRLTQQVFTEAWRDRLDFNPSLGTIRNWLVRRARQRVSKPSAEADAAVDRMVVADSLNRMDERRRQVVLAGFDATDAEALARALDQPVASVRGHLRRGGDLLKADLADSRIDGDAGGLADMMAAGAPQMELVTPPEVVWQAIAAELDLDTGAVISEDFKEGPATATEEDAADHQPGDGDGDGGDQPSEGQWADRPDVDSGSGVETYGPADDDALSVDQLRERAGSNNLDRPGWLAPTVIAVALLILAILVLTAL